MAAAMDRIMTTASWDFRSNGSRSPGDGEGRPDALQALPNPGQTFPNSRPFSPNISKDSFGRFVENQRLARRKRKFAFSKFVRGPPTRLQRPGAWRPTMKNASTIFGFPEFNVGIRKWFRARRPGRRSRRREATPQSRCDGGPFLARETGTLKGGLGWVASQFETSAAASLQGPRFLGGALAERDGSGVLAVVIR